MKPAPPVLVEFTRGNIVESQHRGYVCVVNSSGNILFSRGDPDFVTFLRSSAKPLQAIAAVESGAVDHFHLTESEVAIICGSHSGESFHLDAVRSILNKAGLNPGYLRCGTHPPLDLAAREELRQHDEQPVPLHHNCSGKHAGMLITGQYHSEGLSDYLDPQHPIQVRVVNTIATLASLKPSQIIIGIDGCAAPVHGLSMRAAALALARLVNPEGIKTETGRTALRVSRAMRAYPEMVAGNEHRICTELMRVGRIFELTAKAGAEGYYAAAWRDTQTGEGLGMTVKIEDGAERARSPVVIAMLQKYGILPAQLGAALLPFAPGVIRNYRGDEVGVINVKLE